MMLRLIDIVLIVLFGFISMATIENQRKLELAETEAVRVLDASTEGNITVSVDAWGEFYWQDELAPQSYGQLESRLVTARESYSLSDTVHVRIRADEGAPMGRVKELIQTADELGLNRSLIVVYQEH